MERATRSKRKTNVTIWWWPCWSWCPQELNSLGSILVSVVGSTTTPDTAGWWRRSWPGGAYGETKCGHQSRLSPKTSKWHMFSFTKRKRKLGSLNPFKSRFFLCVVFSAAPFPDEMSIQVPISFSGSWSPRYAKITPVQIQPKQW